MVVGGLKVQNPRDLRSIELLEEMYEVERYRNKGIWLAGRDLKVSLNTRSPLHTVPFLEPSAHSLGRFGAFASYHVHPHGNLHPAS